MGVLAVGCVAEALACFPLVESLGDWLDVVPQLAGERGAARSASLASRVQLQAPLPKVPLGAGHVASAARGPGENQRSPQREAVARAIALGGRESAFTRPPSSIRVAPSACEFDAAAKRVRCGADARPDSAAATTPLGWKRRLSEIVHVRRIILLGFGEKCYQSARRRDRDPRMDEQRTLAQVMASYVMPSAEIKIACSRTQGFVISPKHQPSPRNCRNDRSATLSNPHMKRAATTSRGGGGAEALRQR